MTTRLLRGRLFYLVLGSFIIILYTRLAVVGLGSHADSLPLLPEEHHQAWWTEPPNPETLRTIALSDRRFGAMVGLLTFVIAGLGLGGVVLTVWGLRTGRLRLAWRSSSSPPPAWSYAELRRILFLTVAVALMLPFVRLAAMASQPAWNLDTNLWITLSMLVLDVFVVLAIVAFATGREARGLSRLGLSSRNLWASVKAGFVGYTGVFPWLFLLLFSTAEVARLLGFQPPVEPIHKLIFEEQRTVVLALTALLACVVGPIAEEGFFRGVLYAALRQRRSRWLSMLISGTLFSLIHSNPMGFLPILVLGGLLAYLYEWTGSLAAPIAVHIAHNSLLMGLAMVFRQLAPPG